MSIIYTTTKEELIESILYLDNTANISLCKEIFYEIFDPADGKNYYYLGIIKDYIVKVFVFENQISIKTFYSHHNKINPMDSRTIEHRLDNLPSNIEYEGGHPAYKSWKRYGKDGRTLESVERHFSYFYDLDEETISLYYKSSAFFDLNLDKVKIDKNNNLDITYIFRNNFIKFEQIKSIVNDFGFELNKLEDYDRLTKRLSKEQLDLIEIFIF
jgi:hypothetical protein